MQIKQREYSGYFALLDVDFILADPRLDIPDSAFRLYITLWVLAVKERSVTLPKYYYPSSRRSKTGISTAPLARLARIDHRSVVSAANKLSDMGLIEISETGEITVCGAREKHPNLKWKDEAKQGSLKNGTNQFEFTDKETEAETQSKTKTEFNQSPLSGDDSPALNINEKIRIIYEFYIKHSGRDFSRYKLTPKRSSKIKARIMDGFTMAQLTAAIQAVLNNPWNLGENPQGKKYIELDDHIFRSFEQTEKRINDYEQRWGKVEN